MTDFFSSFCRRITIWRQKELPDLILLEERDLAILFVLKQQNTEHRWIYEKNRENHASVPTRSISAFFNSTLKKSIF